MSAYSSASRSVIPRGWDLDSNDIMEAFRADITPPTSLVPATHPRFGVVPLSDEAIVEARKVAVLKSMQKNTAWCIQIFSARTQLNRLPTYRTFMVQW